MTRKRPYRCDDCGWRGWVVDLGPMFTDQERETAARAMAPDPPNLKRTELARDTRVLDDVDLRRLDLRVARRRSDVSEDSHD